MGGGYGCGTGRAHRLGAARKVGSAGLVREMGRYRGARELDPLVRAAAGAWPVPDRVVRPCGAGWKPDSASAEANLTNRLARQSVLDRAELRVVILGSVLNREVGDASVMCEQVEHLLAVGSRPSVMIQVVPDTPAVAGALGGAFAIATEGTADVAAYTDSIVKGGVYTDPDLVARAARVFDGLRADALPWTQTQDLLGKAGERWTL